MPYGLSSIVCWWLNPFVPNAPFLYPWKHRKTWRFSDVFRGYRKGALGTNELNYDLTAIKNWVFQRNMSFNLGSCKQAQEVICSRKKNKVCQYPLIFNTLLFSKHLSMVLDSRATFNGHLNSILRKTDKAIGLLFKLQNIFLNPELIIIYKAFAWPVGLQKEKCIKNYI